MRQKSCVRTFRSTTSPLPTSCIPAASRSRPTQWPPSTGWPTLRRKPLPKRCSQRSQRRWSTSCRPSNPKPSPASWACPAPCRQPNSAPGGGHLPSRTIPDRVAPHLRQRAMVRMQVANMLIDEAKEGRPPRTLSRRQAAACARSHLSTSVSCSSRPSAGLRKLFRAAATSASSVPFSQPSMTSGWM